MLSADSFVIYIKILLYLRSTEISSIPYNFSFTDLISQPDNVAGFFFAILPFVNFSSIFSVSLFCMLIVSVDFPFTFCFSPAHTNISMLTFWPLDYSCQSRFQPTTTCCQSSCQTMQPAAGRQDWHPETEAA